MATIPTHIHALPRHTNAEQVYPAAVPVYDASAKRIRIGDGLTAGGTVIPNMEDLNAKAPVSDVTALENRVTELEDKPVSTAISYLQLVKPADGLHLIVKQAGTDATIGNSVTLIDTLNNAADRAKVKAFLLSGSDGSWQVCPADGFASPYDGAAVTVDLSALTTLPVTLFYAWYTDSATLSDWASLVFPSSGEAKNAAQSSGIKIQVVSALPDSPEADVLYLIPEAQA